MKTFRDFSLRKVVTDQRGLTTVEYVIALGLIAAVAVGSWQAFGDKVHKHLKNSTSDIQDAFNK